MKNNKKKKWLGSHFKLVAGKKKKAKCDVLGSSPNNKDQRWRHYSVDSYNNLYER